MDQRRNYNGNHTKKLEMKTTLGRVHINITFYLLILFWWEISYDFYKPQKKKIRFSLDTLTVHLVTIDSKVAPCSMAATSQMWPLNTCSVISLNWTEMLFIIHCTLGSKDCEKRQKSH